MSVETEEVILTNSASKFDALLYQFIKLYDRLTVEHSLTTERELELIKNLEDLQEITLDLNNTTSKINSTIKELNQMELTLSEKIQINVSVAIGKLRGNLLELSSRILGQRIMKYVEYCATNLHDTIDKIEKLTKEQVKQDVKVFWMLLGVATLIGLLIGALIIITIG